MTFQHSRRVLRRPARSRHRRLTAAMAVALCAIGMLSSAEVAAAREDTAAREAASVQQPLASSVDASASASTGSGLAVLAARDPVGPREVWREDFESVTGNGPVQLAAYPTTATARYAAGAYWLLYANCNGLVLNYNAATFGSSTCTNGDAGLAQRNVRRLADVLGQVGAGVTGSTSASAPADGSTSATQQNRALVEWTASGDASGTNAGLVAESRASLSASGLQPLAAGSRYYTVSADVAEASCTYLNGANNSLLDVALFAGTQQWSVTPTALRACTSPDTRHYTSPTLVSTGWGSGGVSVRAGTVMGTGSALLTAEQVQQVRLLLSNRTLTSEGNDFAVDRLRVYDATPALDLEYAAAEAVAGEPTTLTFTVTNTSELAAKSDWSFTNALPAGLVVAPTPQIGGTCVNSAGAAQSISAPAGSSTISVSGGDLAIGQATCTVTVQVVAALPGTYDNLPSAVTTMLDATQPASLVVIPRTTVTVQKSLDGARGSSADQFRLTLRQGTTDLATTTTSGSSTGVQPQRIQAALVSVGQTYTIAEEVVQGSTVQAGLNYASRYECVAGETVIARADAPSGSFVVPASATGQEIVCTFTNAARATRMLQCTSNAFYSVLADGSFVQADIATGRTAVLGSFGRTGTNSINSLGISADGRLAYVVERGSTTAASANVVSIRKWTPSGFSAVQGSSYTTTANGVVIDGAIVAGAVDLRDGENRFMFGKFANGRYHIFSFTESRPASQRYAHVGSFATGTSTAGNGDMAFDAKGNLFVVQSLDASTTIYTITAADLAAANGGTIVARQANTRALSDASPALTSVNGIAFSPRGTVYLSDSARAYEFDPTTWTRVPGTSSVPMAATDMASCSTPSTITVMKNIVARAAAGDQFQLGLTTADGTEIANATTAGTATGRQTQQIGPYPAPAGTTLHIQERAAAGTLTPYATSIYECWADGRRISFGELSTGATRGAEMRMPIQMSVAVACTIVNSPQPFATVTVRKAVTDSFGANPQPAGDWSLSTRIVSSSGTAILPTDLADTAAQAARRSTLTTGDDGAVTFYVIFGTAASTAALEVAEAPQAGWLLQRSDCTVIRGAQQSTSSDTSGAAARTVPGAIAPGHRVDCTFTNRPSAALTLKKVVSSGDQAPNSWKLAATRQNVAALPGPTGAGSSAGVSATVSAGAPYRLAETGGPATYVQVGAWSCIDASGRAAAVSDAGDVTLPQGAAVTCTVTNATASITLLKSVQSPRPGFSPSDWRLTATPAALDGLGPVTVAGADYSSQGNAASTFDVRPGHSYTLSETVAQTGSKLSYKQVRLEMRQADGTWAEIRTPTITAPEVGRRAVYRFVNAPVEPVMLPLTGGPSADAYLIAGAAVLALSLSWALIRRLRGRRRAET